MRAANASLIAITASLASLSTQAHAEQVMLTPADDVEGAINSAQPGDELILAGGSYELTERFGIAVSGTVDAPIVIRAADGERPIFHRAAQDQNVIDVDEARHVVFRGLEIAGGSHGLRLIDVSFVTVEDCEIRDTGDVALSANSGESYEALRILRNHIHHTHGTGEGMYLGCNDNGCQVFDSIIEGNYVHHTNDPAVEQGDGIELKEGSYNNVIRDNVIHDTHYPCILTYSTAGNGDPNIIERNLMWHCGDNGIQASEDAVIRNNIILSANGSGIALQPHQSGIPDNLTVVHNTVLAPTNDAITVGGPGGTVVIANNALYSDLGHVLRVSGELMQLITVGNVRWGRIQGPAGGFAQGGTFEQDFVAASFDGAPPLDVFPAVGSALIGAGDADRVTDTDFNGTPRKGVPDVGAYAFDADGNPGWTLAPSFKDVVAVTAPPTGSDAHVPDSSVGTDHGSDSDDSSDGGCGCRLALHTTPPPGASALLLASLAGVAGRRRRSAIQVRPNTERAPCKRS